NAPRFDLSSELKRITGVDLTRIDGIDVMVAQTLLSEVGMDMSRWNTEAHFSSWLGLCPDNRISGDKLLGKGTRHVVNRAATALRLAARNLIRSRSYLGAQYRRLRTKLGARKAITAMAHRLARLVYRMLKYGQQYVDKALSTTSRETGYNKSSSSERRPRNSASESHQPRLEFEVSRESHDCPPREPARRSRIFQRARFLPLPGSLPATAAVLWKAHDSRE